MSETQTLIRDGDADRHFEETLRQLEELANSGVAPEVIVPESADNDVEDKPLVAEPIRGSQGYEFVDGMPRKPRLTARAGHQLTRAATFRAVGLNTVVQRPWPGSW